MKDDIVGFSLICVGSLGLLWIGYSIRFIEQGRFLYTIIATIFFGLGIQYLIETVNHLLNNKKLLGLTSIYMVVLCGYFWYYILLQINTSLISGEVTKHAVKNPIGLFGITGFWGIGIIVLLWIGFILLSYLIACVLVYYERKRNLKI